MLRGLMRDDRWLIDQRQSMRTYLPHGDDDEEADEADEEEEGHRPPERRLADVGSGDVGGGRLVRRLPVHPEQERPEPA